MNDIGTSYFCDFILRRGVSKVKEDISDKLYHALYELSPDDKSFVTELISQCSRQLQILINQYLERFHLGNKDADEVFWMVCISAYQNIDELRKVQNPIGWVYHAAWYHVMHMKREAARQSNPDILDYLPDPKSEFDLGIDELLPKDFSQTDRTILKLRYERCYSMREIALCLDITESAAKQRLKRSRDLLQSYLKSKRFAKYL